jgi:hypothetical protein
MIADPWHDKMSLSEQLFDPDAFEKSIDLVYFDIPQLHQFSEAGDEFFALLEKTPTKNISLFATPIV